MNRLILFFLLLPLCALAQKKPLDHSVYDGWQSIGERLISNDGKWVVYTVTPQEGDANLFIQSVAGSYSMQVPRGYNALITEDSRFAVFKIKPLYKETRDARIKKKKPEDLPKDSVGIIELGTDKLVKVARVRSYKTPLKAFGWVAFQKEKDPAPATGGRQTGVTQKTVDSLRRTIDSLTLLVTQIKNQKSGNRDTQDADDDPVASSSANEGTDLVLRRLEDGKEKLFKNVVDYVFSNGGQKLLLRVSKSPRDTFSANAVVLYDLKKDKLDTILKGGNDFRNFSMTEDGSTAAFVGERDTAKSLQKFYGLYVYKTGDDSAHLLADKNSVGMEIGMTISENGIISFSKTGSRLFFGTAPIQPPKDTTLVDFETAKLDIWNYKDDYLQTQQLFQLNNELKRNYLAVYDLAANKMVQLGSKGLPTIIPTKEGDGTLFIGVTDTGRRVSSQWAGSTRKDIYAVNVSTGMITLVKKNHDGQVYPSSTGNYILLYDNKVKNYFVWNGKGMKNITAKIKTPLFNEENDVPDDPNPYGIMSWHEKDSFVYVYDRYDVWKVDPQGNMEPSNITATGRKTKDAYRYVKVDDEEKYLRANQPLYFRVQNQVTKQTGYAYSELRPQLVLKTLVYGQNGFNGLARAQNNPAFIYTKESFMESPDLFVSRDVSMQGAHTSLSSTDQGTRLSVTNPQQSSYNWGTAELYKWKAFDGKAATGILYKPEDFDSTKKYPMLIYFYEKLSDGLYNYIAPSPTPSRLNIPFFVSRGYLVFTPDISYTKGHPGKDAYNYIVSGAQALAKKKWVDGKNIGIQGQSWGGYQVAYLITATNMFKAAWAGAPVVNMFSAYGGIRWESGNNRQFQYEKGQSRIGYTPWEKPELYVENSPLFHLQKVTTPLVIMSNDADGAVPWYQGIEFFTAMRRLNKKVWLLNYNGEAHNLVERRNRKDIQIREQEYFDWQLKGAKPGRWLVEGVPAVKKGKDWGLEVVDEQP